MLVKRLFPFFLVAMAIRAYSYGFRQVDNHTSSDTDAVECEKCFAIELLPLRLREYAGKLLLNSLDNEALYSIMSDIKPMSSGWASLSFPDNDTLSKELADLQQIANVFHCGRGLTAGIQIFNASFHGNRYAEGVFFRREAFETTIAEYESVFSTMGELSSELDPTAVISVVDADSTINRFRAYGHLFGYPEYAVNFFAEAEAQRLNGGDFVERDFLYIPTYTATEGNFVYAVPKGHSVNKADIKLAERARPVLEAYNYARKTYASDSATWVWVTTMMREVFRQSDGMCSVTGVDFYVSIHGHKH